MQRQSVTLMTCLYQLSIAAAADLRNVTVLVCLTAISYCEFSLITPLSAPSSCFRSSSMLVASFHRLWSSPWKEFFWKHPFIAADKRLNTFLHILLNSRTFEQNSIWTYSIVSKIYCFRYFPELFKVHHQIIRFYVQCIYLKILQGSIIWSWTIWTLPLCTTVWRQYFPL